ncbi:MAG: hypothetical protein NTY19_30785 [Planctomycetota bacterium]|nr:hypothetical protein [Planctomycetota bacterium]
MHSSTLQEGNHYPYLLPPKPIDRYEIQVRYSNGDLISGTFRDKNRAIEFLQTYELAG